MYFIFYYLSSSSVILLQYFEYIGEQNFSFFLLQLLPMIDMEGIVNWLSSSVLDELVDDAVLGVVFEVHRASKLGFLAVEEGSKEAGLAVDQNYPIVVEANLDVFGQAALKNKQHECICPSCNRALAASRFAPHLEKCQYLGHQINFLLNIILSVYSNLGMGMGRNS